jgi:hypothetical protein
MRVVVLNSSDAWPDKWHESDPGSYFPIIEPFFKALFDAREELTNISFGLVLYERNVRGFREILDRDVLKEWEVKYHTSRYSAYPQCRVVWS